MVVDYIRRRRSLFPVSRGERFHRVEVSDRVFKRHAPVHAPDQCFLEER
jgi:hypothetical protein